jgi:aldehyde dehydrogenase (NAD+)
MTELTPASAVPVAPAAPPWEYAPAPESTDVVRLRDRYGLFVGGSFVEPASGRWSPTISPATEDALAEVAEAGEEDVDRAVAAAREAYEQRWRDLPGAERAKYL